MNQQTYDIKSDSISYTRCKFSYNTYELCLSVLSWDVRMSQIELNFLLQIQINSHTLSRA